MWVHLFYFHLLISIKKAYKIDRKEGGKIESTKRTGFFLFINNTVIFMVILFIVISTITSVLSTKLSSEYVGNILRKVQSTELYLNIIQSQNHYMTGKDVEVPKLPIMELTFELATNLKPYDIRSFLGNEIPGFFAYDTQFYVAGKGTDYTDIPFESVAPMEVLLKEREIAEEMLLADEKEEEPTPAPEKSMDETIVHIYQSHSWESYLPLLRGVSEPDDATSNNPEANVIAVGKMLKKELADKGIKANHDTRNVPKDLAARGWNYNHSYQYSRETVEAAMTFNSDVEYLIDIHRDALRKEKTTEVIDGKSYARLLFVVGTAHKGYEKNLEFAERIHNAIEKKYPGLSRGVIPKGKSTGNGLYNQDLSNRAILLEVGGVDNNLEEARNSIKAFADIYSEIVWEEREAEEF